MKIKFTGNKYTWWNDRINEDSIFERLDKVLVNSEFFEAYPLIEAQHLARQGLYHAPV